MCPAISPASGHVMGLATWRAVLKETGKCPFTQKPLAPSALIVLNKNNIDKWREKIVGL